MNQDALSIPQQIDKYKIEGLMTRGGMSLLYLATHPDTQEPLIVKVLLPKYLSEHDVVERFLNEARVIALANHPNIIRLISSGVWQNGLYIAMEFVKGSSLRKILQHQPYSLKRALDVLLQIAYAIAHLHAHGVVHGDLKPENILINEQGQVKVIDFGIAQLLTDLKKEYPSRFVGTPIYMSPELGLDRRNVSFQSDIYALGIIAYELALGKISHGRVILSLAPRGLQKILHKALQPRPEDRYSDMCDFISDLTGYIKSETFQKDKHGSDYFLEIFEELEQLQGAITSDRVPSWPDTESGIVYLQGLGLSGQYIDFLELEKGKKAIIMAECDKKGATGLVSVSALRAMFRTLMNTQKKAPLSKITQELLERIEKDLFKNSFSFCILIIDFDNSSYEYFQNTYGALIHYAQESATFSQITLPQQATFCAGDQLYIFGSSSKINFLPLLEEQAAVLLSQPAQNQSESLIRKARMLPESDIEEKPLCLITLHVLNSYGKKLPPLK